MYLPQIWSQHVELNKDVFLCLQHFKTFVSESDNHRQQRVWQLTKWLVVNKQTLNLQLTNREHLMYIYISSLIQLFLFLFSPSSLLSCLCLTLCLRLWVSGGDNMSCCQRSSAHSGMMGKTVSDLGHQKNSVSGLQGGKSHFSPCQSSEWNASTERWWWWWFYVFSSWLDELWNLLWHVDPNNVTKRFHIWI